MTWQALPYIMLLAFCYGSTLIATRFAVGQYDPLTYVGLRLSIAALVHVAVYALINKRKFPSNTRLLSYSILLGVFGTALTLSMIVFGMQYVSSGIASVIFVTAPAITALVANFFLADEQLTWRKTLGIGLSLGGAVLLAARGESGLAESVGSWRGYLLISSAVVISSFAMVFARKWMQGMDFFDVASVRMLTAAALVLPLSLWWSGFDLSQVTPVGYMALVWAALLGTFSAIFLSFYNTVRFGATQTAMVSYFVPVFGAVGGYFLLDEIITPWMLLGMGIIFAGLWVLRRSNSVQEGTITQQSVGQTAD